VKRETLVKWGRGLLGGAISSAANGVSVVIADPLTFNLTTAGGFGKLLFVMGVSAFVGALLYLKTHPLPGDEGGA
jgi:hypothetical protein